MQELRQNTSCIVPLGPFVDSEDGDTLETELSIAQADVRLSKNGGNFAQKNEASASSHDELAMYACNLGITDANTLGRLRIAVREAGALIWWQDFMVVKQAYWDWKYGAGALPGIGLMR